MNVQNLKKAIDLFEKKDFRPVAGLIANKLEMSYYSGISEFSKKDVFENSTSQVNACGTTACFLGWFPFLNDVAFDVKESDFISDEFFDYTLYSERVLNLKDFKAWMYLFHFSWPNSIESCLTRSRNLVAFYEKFGHDNVQFDDVDFKSNEIYNY